MVAVWVAPQGDELAERQESVPGVVLPAAWVFGLKSRPFNNSTERHCVCSPGESKRAVSEPSHWIVYILECVDQTLYTGITNDLDHRINQHENGRGAKYTRGRAPFKLLYTETHSTRSQALKREAEIKSFDRAAKLKLASACMRRKSRRQQK